MTSGPMRKLQPRTSPSPLRWKSLVVQTHRLLLRRSIRSPLRQILSRRSLAQVRPEPLSEVWFTSTSPPRGPADELLGSPAPGGHNENNPPDERILKLGKTLRTLSPLLPNILTTPLPQEILSPSISLHLFPSTHPHLPAVKGRVPYRAALWTAPVAWGCVPIVGNVKLQILSEKIVRTGLFTAPIEDDRADHGEEKLVVRWRTENRNNGSGNSGSTSNPSTTSSNTSDPSFSNSTQRQSGNGTNGTGINRGLSALLGGDKPIFNLSKDDDFSGIFIFSFDSKGRVATHTIEHADENSGFDKTSRVVTLTDWLLGKAKWGRGREDDLVPGLAMRVCRDEWAKSHHYPTHRHDNRFAGGLR